MTRREEATAPGWAAGASDVRAPAKRAWFLCLVSAAAWLVLACSVREGTGAGPVRRVTRPMMGTLVEVLWRETARHREDADSVRQALDRMEALARDMSLFDPESELARINAAAGRSPVKVSREMMEVVRKAVEVAAMTGGAFDATVGSVEAVWGDIQRAGAVGRVPGEAALRNALEAVGYAGVRLDPEAGTVFLTRSGARLDLGGIAKGYIIDRGVESLRERGSDCFMVNAGGDIRAHGCALSPAWKVGLQDPFDKGSLLGVFRVRDGSVVTSGSYERYVETGQGRLSHILDPKTGRPVQGPVSVTVVAGEAALADGLATAFMVTGRQGAVSLLLRLGSVRVAFVEADGTVWIDDRLRDTFEAGPLPDTMPLRFFSVEEPGVSAPESASP